MSSRLTFLVSTAIVALGVSAVSFAQGGPFARPIPQDVQKAMSERGSRSLPQSIPMSGPLGGSAYIAPTPQQPQNTASPYASPAPQSQPAAIPAASAAQGQYYPPAQRAATHAPAQAPALSRAQIQAASPVYGAAQRPQQQAQGQSFFPPRRAPNPAAYHDPNYAPNSYDNSKAGRVPGQASGQYSAPQKPQYAQHNLDGNRADNSGPPNSGPMGNPMPWPQTGPQTQNPGPNSGPMGGPKTRQSKPSFWQRLGFGKLKFANDGYARMGDAAVMSNDETRNELVADIMVRSEVSAITQGGTEYGVSLKLRGQRDRLREGFGGQVGDCPPGFIDCASANGNTATQSFANNGIRNIKGHTSQLYAGGAPQAREHKIALEGAHLFLRSSYGDITLGRDDGSAALFSLSAPSTLPLARSSNARVDYTGLDMTKTLNDASGFAEKITYTSPRMLGDKIGFGVQVGMSYAPNTEACGVDYCVRGHDRSNVQSPLTPQLTDAIELGLSIDRKFDSGLSLELAANYATASEQSGIVGFDDLSSYGLGFAAGFGDFKFGTNYLNSNNGIAGDGGYSAVDAGLTWKPNDFGVTLGYGQSTDDNVGANGSALTLGASYDLGGYTLGTGLQYSERDVQVFNSGTNALDTRNEDAIGIFLEGGFTF